MAGFTRDERRYGDRLVYELRESKARRWHRYCDCGASDLTGVVDAHLPPAGFEVLVWGSGFLAVIGPGIAAQSSVALYHALSNRPQPSTAGRHDQR